MRSAIHAARIAHQEHGQHRIDRDKNRNAQPRAGKERQSRKLLRHANRKWIRDGGRKTHVRRQDAHPQPDERIPAQEIRERNHQRDERHNFFKDAKERAQQHKEKRDGEQQKVLFPAECLDDAANRGLKDAAFIQHGKRAAHHQQKDDDGDDRDCIRPPQDFDRRGEPAPDGISGPRHVLERLRVNGLAACLHRPRVASGGNDLGQDARGEHQDEQDDRRLDERSGADLCACFLFHCHRLSGLFFYVVIRPEHGTL